MNSRLAGLVFSSVLALGSALRAEELAGPAPAAPAFVRAPSGTAPIDRHWYGGTVLAADAATIGLLGAGGLGHTAPGYLGAGAYLVASPIIHFAYDGLGASLGTLAVRVGLPAAGALVGAGLASDCRKDLCSLGAAGLGMAVGMGAAMVVDVAVLAWRDTPAE
jgi:hypothetical protein